MTFSWHEILTGLVRLAVYFVPGDGTPLARFGEAVLGRDALGRPTAPLEGLPEAPPEWTARPARYGFHATLKAPFRLAEGVAEADVAAACGALARAHGPCPLAGLGVRRLGRFVALALPGPDAAVDALAADAVVALEPCRAPLDAAELARRRPATLAPEARARLERWGYPHVLEGFRFHMTLSAPLPADERAADAWVDALAARFSRAVPGTPRLDRLALCRQAAPDAPFARVAEFALGG